MVAREGSAPSTSGCRPDVILFHHRAVLAHGHDWLPGLDLHQHKRLQRALSYELDDPANWWPASVTLRVQRLKRPLLHFKACRPKWCSRQESHLHCRRSQRRVSAGWTTRVKLEPPDGDAPSGFLYKRNPQAAAWRRLASLTGFAPVISCLRGRRVG